jgi:hypothetical protein
MGEVLASRKYARVVRSIQPDRPLSLTKYRRRYLEQKQAGTCWTHAPTQHAEVVAVARGHKNSAFDICRRLTAWQGKQLEGGGNPDDGGSGLDALVAMSRLSGKGVGIAHESLCPYTDDRRTLGTRPPQAVFDDAQASHLEIPVVVRDLDEVVTLLYAEAPSPTCIGVWCPDCWFNGKTVYEAFGRGSYGHEVLVVGFAPAGTVHASQDVFQVDNWWGLIYPALPPALAAKVDGYAPFGQMTSDFWVTRRFLEGLISKGNAEFASATDVIGLAGDVVEPVSSLSLL